jgi:hypothetical protein
MQAFQCMISFLPAGYREYTYEEYFCKIVEQFFDRDKKVHIDIIKVSKISLSPLMDLDKMLKHSVTPANNAMKLLVHSLILLYRAHMDP